MNCCFKKFKVIKDYSLTFLDNQDKSKDLYFIFVAIENKISNLGQHSQTGPKKNTSSSEAPPQYSSDCIALFVSVEMFSQSPV